MVLFKAIPWAASAILNAQHYLLSFLGIVLLIVLLKTVSLPYVPKFLQELPLLKPKLYLFHKILPSFFRKRISFADAANANPTSSPATVPISVNYFFTRRCNYSCGFCFHTAKTSHILPFSEIKRGLKLLKDAGMRKINFAGGEPFLYPELLGKMAQYCKEDLEIESVSIISNGSLVKERWFGKYGKYIDILGISCDSFVEETNNLIGRKEEGSANKEKLGEEQDGKSATMPAGRMTKVKTFSHVGKVLEIADMCRNYGIKFKINTVVNKFNWEEDMNPWIEKLKPDRWKVFQVLAVDGENQNSGNQNANNNRGEEKALRDVTPFLITDSQFKYFCQRHSHHPCFIPEGNDVMMSSYLMLDEYMRFLDKSCEKVSGSILDEKVDVKAAFLDAGWDQEAFAKRGGVYDWSRTAIGAGGYGELGPLLGKDGEGGGCCGADAGDRKLDW